MPRADQIQCALPLLILGLAGCGSSSEPSPPPPPPPPPSVATVVVAPDAPALVPNATVQLTATPTDGAGNALAGRAVTWSSSNGTVATVSSGGLVTGVTAGTATITATSEGKVGSAALTVLDGAVLGPAGGVVTAANGAVVLTVPAGALTQPTTLTVAPIAAPPADPRTVPGTAYDIGPNGTQFAQPVTLAIKYDPTKVPAGDGQDGLRTFTYDPTARHWIVTDPVGSVDSLTHIVSGFIHHLSPKMVANVNPVDAFGQSIFIQGGSGQVWPGSLWPGDTPGILLPTFDGNNHPTAPKHTYACISHAAGTVVDAQPNVPIASQPFLWCHLTGINPGTTTLDFAADATALTGIPVTVLTPTIALTVAPSSFSIPAGQTGSTNAALTITGNKFPAPINLTFILPPNTPWLTAGVHPISVSSDGPTSATLNIAVFNTAAVPGDYPVVVTASATVGTFTVRTTTTFTVNVGPPASGSITFQDGGGNALNVQYNLAGAWNTAASVGGTFSIGVGSIPSSNPMAVFMVRHPPGSQGVVAEVDQATAGEAVTPEYGNRATRNLVSSGSVAGNLVGFSPTAIQLNTGDGVGSSLIASTPLFGIWSLIEHTWTQDAVLVVGAEVQTNPRRISRIRQALFPTGAQAPPAFGPRAATGPITGPTMDFNTGLTPATLPFTVTGATVGGVFRTYVHQTPGFFDHIFGGLDAGDYFIGQFSTSQANSASVFPAGSLPAGAVQDITLQETNNADFSNRCVKQYFVDPPANLNLLFGPPMSPIAVTDLHNPSFKQLRITFPVQAAYNRAYAIFIFNGSSQVYIARISAASLGGASTFDFTMPDIPGAAQYMPQNGTPLFVQVVAKGWTSPGGVFGPAPVDGQGAVCAERGANVP